MKKILLIWFVTLLLLLVGCTAGTQMMEKKKEIKGEWTPEQMAEMEKKETMEKEGET